jgi:fatty-acyl-CoA synthase
MVFTGPHLHAEDLLDQMQVDPPNFFLGVPTVMLSMLQLHEGQPGKWKLPAMRCQVGGSSVPPSLIAAFARHGVNIRQGWGMTEMSPLGSLFYEKPELSGKLTEEQWLQRKSLAGVPPPLVDIRIVADGAEQPWDGTSIGEIQVRGPFVTGRYHGLEPDLEKFTSDGWLRTGDVGSIDTNGYVRVTDRTKDLIKSGGEWISSVDLENAIMGHPAVSEAAVIAVPHAKWGERPLACVVLKPGAKLTARALLDHIAPHFAKWQLPDAVEFMEAIPRNSTGKFWKSKLRETFANYPLPA